MGAVLLDLRRRLHRADRREPDAAAARVQLKDDERAGGWAAYRELLARRDVRLFFLGIMAYVGTEQTLANWMSQFLSTYHGVSATTDGADAVAGFWGADVAGVPAGSGPVESARLTRRAGRLHDAGHRQRGACALRLRPRRADRLPGLGLLPVRDVLGGVLAGPELGAPPPWRFSGVLCTGILGGAVVPLLVGGLGDAIGLRAAMSTVFLTLLYILGVSAWARPLVTNDVVPAVPPAVPVQAQPRTLTPPAASSLCPHPARVTAPSPGAAACQNPWRSQ